MLVHETVANISEALQLRHFPAITLWNRLDGRPRAENFDRALKAEVRDPLWMLCKQWQMGEFKGDDAASPVFAKVHIETTELNKYQPNNHGVQTFEQTVPLETKVEHRPIPFTRQKQSIALDIRLLMGRQWAKLLVKESPTLAAYAKAFMAAFPVTMPNTTDKTASEVYAHREVWQQFAAVAGRKMDGYDLLVYLKKSPLPPQYNDLPNAVLLPILDQTKVDSLNIVAKKFKDWYDALFYQPENPEENAWQSDALEYQFACSAPIGSNQEKVLVAKEYYQGHLDWYNLDIDSDKTALATPPNPLPSNQKGKTQAFIPAPLAFNGMPNTRWWAFEDRRTNFGDIKPDTNDVAKLLLIEFGLVYANDWFLIPVPVPMGSITEVKGLSVTNVFGERLWIEAAGRGLANDWQRWAMFGLGQSNKKAAVQADTSLLMLPTVPKIQEGKPLEEVMLIRDEMANMVWGIETVVPLAHGKGKSGSETATETRQFFDKRAVPLGPLPENDAKIRYEVMNAVPENWIPFIPVKIPNDIREIQLQRASMPRAIIGQLDAIQKVKPLTALLREGLEGQPVQPYFIHEEEVPRAGVVVSQSFQRTRWLNGRILTWLGVRKQTGRGEGNSNLRFDSLRQKE